MLATLLHYANAKPPHINKEGFYALKDRLLQKYATPLNDQWQFIEKSCWGAYETGVCSAPKKWCPRCGYLGYYERKWIKLKTYTWDGYTFHSPVADSWRCKRPENPDIIGYIRHEEVGMKGHEARLWLYLLCGEWRLLWRELRGHCYSTQTWWPLLNLQKIIFRLPTLERQACYKCGCQFFIGRRHWNYCQSCRTKLFPSNPPEGNDDIPF